MNDVPLIQRTDVNSINTSIIAIKKQLKQIEQMLGGIGETELPADILYRKDIADAVQEGNNNPVSSGAVDEAIKSLDVSSVGGSGKYISAIEEVDGKINATANDITDIVPVGAIFPFYGTIAPSGWLICNGQSFSSTTYPALYALLGSTNVPDLRNKTLMGANPNVSGRASGNTSNVGAVQTAQLPKIVGNTSSARNDSGGSSVGALSVSGVGHTARSGSGAGFEGAVLYLDSSKQGASSDHLGNNVYATSGEVRSANLRVNFIIKAK